MPLCIIHGVLVFSFKLYTMVLISAPKKGEIPIPSFWLACLYQMLGGKNRASTEVCPYVARLNEADRRNICGSFFVFFLFSALFCWGPTSQAAHFFVDWWTTNLKSFNFVSCQVTIFRGPAEKGYPFLKENFNETLGWDRPSGPSAKCTRNVFFHWIYPPLPPGCNTSVHPYIHT